MPVGIKKSTKRLTLCAVLTALGVVVLSLGSLLEVLDLSAAALAGMLVVIVVIEVGGPWPWLVWAATGFISLLLPLKTAAVFYLIFAGYYPILKEKIDEILRKKDRPHERIPFIKGESPASLKMYDYMMLVAPTLLSVLIWGESGTGKEYVANHIHQNSSRRDGPFVALDCGAIPRDLASSELFGHLKGSFTSAISDKKGAFEMADGGTLFLDEVGNLSHDVQMQLLRALQEGVIKPVGSARIIEVNIRIITATNVDLKQMIEQGKFREDLYHRINEFQLHIPRLQERGQDVMLFARHFLEYANRQMNRKITGFSPGAEQLMMAYNWRGNLRELLNMVKRTVLLSEGPEIQATDLPEEIRGFQSLREGQDAQTLKEQHERQMITEALARTRNNRTRAARLLGIDRKTLYNKMKLYNLE